MLMQYASQLTDEFQIKIFYIKKPSPNNYVSDFIQKGISVESIFNIPVFFRNYLKSDFVIGWMYHSFLILDIISRLYQKPFLKFSHHLDPNDTKWITRMLIKCSLLLSAGEDDVAIVSRSAECCHRKFGFKNLVYMPNFINMPSLSFDASRKALFRKNFPNKKRFVGYFGRIHPDKNIPLLLDVIEASDDSYLFLFFGEDFSLENEKLRKLLHSRKTEGKCYFGGFVTDIFSWMSICDTILVTSVTESFGLVIAEAFAGGIYAIIPPVSACREVSVCPELIFEEYSVNAVLEILNVFYRKIDMGDYSLPANSLADEIRKKYSADICIKNFKKYIFSKIHSTPISL